MTKKSIKLMSITLLALTVNVATLQTTTVLANHQQLEQINNKFSNLSEESMLRVLNAASAITEDMLERGNQIEIKRFMLSHGIDIKFENEQYDRDFWGCLGAITWAVGTTALGIGMLAKLKKFVSAAGGVKAAATALMAIARNGATTENIQKFGYVLVEIGGTILGITEIRDNCF